MTFKKKALSVLLACFMITALFCAVSVSAEIEAEKLLELNLDELVETTVLKTGDDIDSSGITNNYDGWGETLDIHGKHQGDANKTAASSIYKAYAKNLDGEETTPVIKFENNVKTWAYNGTNFRIRNKKFEDEDNTIAFWANITVGSKNAGIFDYRGEKAGGSTVNTTLWEFDASLTSNGDVLIHNSGDNKAAAIETGWNHFAIVNRAAVDGIKLMELYINGSHVCTEEISASNAASLANATIAFAAKWDVNSGGNYGYNNFLADSAMYGNIEVYNGALDEDDIFRVYYDSQPDYGLTSPNLVVSVPDEVKPDSESITITMLNNVDKNEVKELPLINKEDGSEFPSSYEISGNKVIITPKDYLTPGKKYKVDFPPGYCGDYTFTVTGSGVYLDSAPNIRTNFVGLNLINEEDVAVKVIVLGYDEDGFVTTAAMQDYETSISVPGIGNCKTIKVFIWGQDGDKFVPLTDAFIINR